MADKMFNTRIIHKHDIEANWVKAVNFIPKEAELVIYDPDENFNYARTKIGDGIRSVNDLPFVNIQTDWNQNDENAADFVKNRTHYKDIGFAPIFNENVRYDGYEAGFYVYNFSHIIGETYRVSIDNGEDQEFVLNEDLQYVYVHPTNGKTYTLNFYDGWYSIYIQVSDTETREDFNLQIKTKQEIYHTIPREYLPEMVGQMYENSNHGEIFNDYEENIASGEYSHAEGSGTKASGIYSHAEGYNTSASGSNAHAEGNHSVARGSGSHAEGGHNVASGEYSHAEGFNTTASGENSHAEGYQTLASGENSHAEGFYTESIGQNSHVQGRYNRLRKYKVSDEVVLRSVYRNPASTVKYKSVDDYILDEHNGKFILIINDETTKKLSELTPGQYFTSSSNFNQSSVYGLDRLVSYDVNGNLVYEELDTELISDYNDDYAHIVGNGISIGTRSNAHTLDWSGNAWYSGDVYVGSASGIDRDEGSKKLATEDYVNNKVEHLPTGDEDDALELLMEIEAIIPMTTLDNKLITDSTGKIYIL